MIVTTSFIVSFSFFPERAQFVSADKILTVSGLARESQNISIETVAPYLYRVLPESGVLESPLMLTFDLTTDAGRDHSVSVYWFDPDIYMWSSISEVIVPEELSVSVERYELGLFAVLEAVDVEAPNFLTEFDELLTMAPKTAVGFRMDVGVRSQDGSLVLIPGSTQFGGCGGAIGNGNMKERSQREKSARVYVNDVETEVEFVFSALWYVSDNGGCVDELPLATIKM